MGNVVLRSLALSPHPLSLSLEITTSFEFFSALLQEIPLIAYFICFIHNLMGLFRKCFPQIETEQTPLLRHCGSLQSKGDLFQLPHALIQTLETDASIAKFQPNCK